MIGEQLSIPELTAHLSQTHTAVGVAGEILVARTLEGKGYSVRIDHEKGGLTAISPDGEIVQIEVKTARQASDKCWHFTLYKHWQGRLCTDHHNADVVVLLCVMKSGDAIPFVVPVSDLGNRRSVTVTSYPRTYAGWLAAYRQTLRKLHLPE